MASCLLVGEWTLMVHEACSSSKPPGKVLGDSYDQFAELHRQGSQWPFSLCTSMVPPSLMSCLRLLFEHGGQAEVLPSPCS